MLTRWLALVRGLWRRDAIAREVEEEVEFHLHQEAARHRALGATPEEARRLAAADFGGPAAVRTAVADVRTTSVEVIWRELRLGVRTLAASRAFTVPAVTVLALGIGGTTMIFSIIHGVLLSPLRFTDPEHLVRVWSRNDERQIPFLSVSPADFEDWRARTAPALDLAAYERPRLVPADGELAEPLSVMPVSPELFPLLGVQPALGRTFDPSETRSPLAIVSDGLWHRQFGGRDDAIGRAIVIEQRPLTIVGVMPRNFEVPNARADVWTPFDPAVPAPARFAHMLRVLARPREPRAAATVQRDLDAVAAQLSTERPAENHGWRVTVLPLFDTVVSPELRRSLWITAGAVLLVLLMATTNVAGLLLARSTTRERELAVRVALGASRGNLVRLLLLECLVLAALAGVAGLTAASWGLNLVRDSGAGLVPRLDEVTLSGHVFVGSATISILSALLAGVVPAWRSTRSLHDRMRSRGVASEPVSGRALPLLVVVEISSAVLLVVGAALLVQTVRNLHTRALGFDGDRVLSITMAWPPLPDRAQRVARVDEMLARLSREAAVTLAAAVDALPFSGSNSGNTFEIEGTHQAGQPLPDTDYRVVSPAYFAVLGIPLQRGRVFADTDRGRGVVDMSRTAAARFWPNGDPLGSRVKLGSSDWLTVVGVVGDARYGALDAPDETVRPMMYVPHWQMPDTPMTFAARTEIPPALLGEGIRRALGGGDGVRVSRVEALTAMVRAASATNRFAMNVVSAFAGAAIALALAGLYGLLALIVGRRTREIAVRLALGARTSQIVRRLLARTVALTSAGVAAGLTASLWLGAALRGVLFGIAPHDPATYAAVALGFVAFSVIVGSLAIRRVVRIDPIQALQTD